MNQVPNSHTSFKSCINIEFEYSNGQFPILCRVFQISDYIGIGFNGVVIAA
jgi:hypothetical protein